MTTMPPEPPQSQPPTMPPPPSYPAGGYGGPPAQQYGSGVPQLAGWGSRVGAFLIDGFIVAAIYLVGFILAWVTGSEDALGTKEPNFMFILLGWAGGLGFLVWQLVKQGQTGQTIGKGVLNIRLLREQDGQPIGAGLSIARYFVHVLDAIPCYIGYLWPLWDAKKQTFADKILGTVVVQA